MALSGMKFFMKLFFTLLQGRGKLFGIYRQVYAENYITIKANNNYTGLHNLYL